MMEKKQANVKVFMADGSMQLFTIHNKQTGNALKMIICKKLPDVSAKDFNSYSLSVVSHGKSKDIKEYKKNPYELHVKWGSKSGTDHKFVFGKAGATTVKAKSTNSKESVIDMDAVRREDQAKMQSPAGSSERERDIDIRSEKVKGWINLHLGHLGHEVSDIEKDLKDGIICIKLVETLSGKKMPKYNDKPATLTDKIENLSLWLKLLSHVGLRVENANSEELYAGNVVLMLAIMEGLMKKFKAIDTTGRSTTAHKPPPSSAPPSRPPVGGPPVGGPPKGFSINMSDLKNRLKAKGGAGLAGAPPVTPRAVAKCNILPPTTYKYSGPKVPPKKGPKMMLGGKVSGFPRASPQPKFSPNFTVPSVKKKPKFAPPVAKSGTKGFPKRGKFGKFGKVGAKKSAFPGGRALPKVTPKKKFPPRNLPSTPKVAPPSVPEPTTDQRRASVVPIHIRSESRPGVSPMMGTPPDIVSAAPVTPKKSPFSKPPSVAPPKPKMAPPSLPSLPTTANTADDPFDEFTFDAPEVSSTPKPEPVAAFTEPVVADSPEPETAKNTTTVLSLDDPLPASLDDQMAMFEEQFMGDGETAETNGELSLDDNMFADMEDMLNDVANAFDF
mmetsp:Transcript_7666/g.8428  ORF Transcript_7666/g.8428 Transcript_7666/m.8428 type:complete len:612 (-) Transcript_7666:144-1979(-)